MITVYGAMPEFFETQDAAIQHFNPTSSNIDLGEILLVAGGILLIGVACYYTYLYFEDRKVQARYSTI